MAGLNPPSTRQRFELVIGKLANRLIFQLVGSGEPFVNLQILKSALGRFRSDYGRNCLASPMQNGRWIGEARAVASMTRHRRAARGAHPCIVFTVHKGRLRRTGRSSVPEETDPPGARTNLVRPLPRCQSRHVKPEATNDPPPIDVSALASGPV